jgi:hypothetical protein
VIRNLFKEVPQKPRFGILGARLPEAYQLTIPKVKKPVAVLGPYTTACGGCDRLIPFSIIPDLILKYAKEGHVIFEGVIVASIYGQIGTLMEQFKKDAVFLFLDTSLEDCISRVRARREDRTDLREFNPTHLTTKYRATQRVHDKVKTDGIMRAETVSTEDAHKVLIKLLQGAK